MSPANGSLGARPVPLFVCLDHLMNGLLLIKYGADDITLTGSTTFLADQLLAKKKHIPYSSWTAERTRRKSIH